MSVYDKQHGSRLSIPMKKIHQNPFNVLNKVGIQVVLKVYVASIEGDRSFSEWVTLF